MLDSICSPSQRDEIDYGQERFTLLQQLYNNRKALLKSVGINITFQELKGMYK